MDKSKFTFDWPLVGNAHITEYLERLVRGGEVGGTFIFSGPDNLGKTTVARHFAQSLLCANKRAGSGPLPCFQCPACRQFADKGVRGEEAERGEEASAHGDYHFIKKEKDKKNISVEQAREFIRKLGMTSFLGSFKIGIVKHADRLSEGAANSLLKTLEEPKKEVIIILICAEPESLPATIVSRSQVLRFAPVPADKIYDHLIAAHKAARSQAKTLSRLSLGRPALAVKFLEDREFYEKYASQARCFLDFFKEDLNERLVAIEELLKGLGSGQELAARAGRILEIWRGLGRDLILAEYGLDNLIQHELADEQIRSVKTKLPVREAIRIANLLKQAEANIRANVSPKSALEAVAISI